MPGTAGWKVYPTGTVPCPWEQCLWDSLSRLPNRRGLHHSLHLPGMLTEAELAGPREVAGSGPWSSMGAARCQALEAVILATTRTNSSDDPSSWQLVRYSRTNAGDDPSSWQLVRYSRTNSGDDLSSAELVRVDPTPSSTPAGHGVHADSPPVPSAAQRRLRPFSSTTKPYTGSTSSLLATTSAPSAPRSNAARTVAAGPEGRSELPREHHYIWCPAH